MAAVYHADGVFVAVVKDNIDPSGRHPRTYLTYVYEYISTSTHGILHCYENLGARRKLEKDYALYTRRLRDAKYRHAIFPSKIYGQPHRYL